MESCERWFSPSLTYCSVSSMTMPEPLSALLIAITPLHAASGNGHKDTVQVMLRNITNSTHIDCMGGEGRGIRGRGTHLTSLLPPLQDPPDVGGDPWAF